MKIKSKILSLIFVAAAVSPVHSLSIESEIDRVFDVIDVIGTAVYYIGMNTLEAAIKNTIPAQGRSIININSNVPDAEVYLNDVYKGRTSLSLANLPAGKYKLEVRKVNYETEVRTITVKSGYELTYDVVLKKKSGTVILKNVPPEANVFVDDEEVETQAFDFVAGEHQISIECFGYEPYSETINIPESKTIEFTPALNPCDFRFNSIQVSRSKINPSYKGSMSQSVVSFTVSKKGAGRLSVYAPDGTLTNTCYFNDFTSGDQTYTWKGLSDKGEKLKAGEYWIEIEAEGKRTQISVIIDYDMRYLLLNNSYAGLCYGKVPVIEQVTFSKCALSMGAGPVFKGTYFDSVDLNLAFNGTGKYVSGGLQVDGYAFGTEGMSCTLSGNLRLFNSCKFNDRCKFNYGALVRYGYAFNSHREPVLDFGAGLGGGVILGISAGPVDLSGTCQYIAGCKTGNILEGKNLIQAGFSAGVKLFETAALYTYGNYYFNNIAEFGVGFNLLPFGNGVVLNLTGDAAINISTGEFSNITGKTGITFLF